MRTQNPLFWALVDRVATYGQRNSLQDTRLCGRRADGDRPRAIGCCAAIGRCRKLARNERSLHPSLHVAATGALVTDG